MSVRIKTLPVIPVAYAIPHFLRILRRVIRLETSLVQADDGQALVANGVREGAVAGIIEADGDVALARLEVVMRGFGKEVVGVGSGGGSEESGDESDGVGVHGRGWLEGMGALKGVGCCVCAEPTERVGDGMRD